MNDDFEFMVTDPRLEAGLQGEIRELLAKCGLDYEQGLEAAVVCRSQGRMIACGGLEGNIVKCVAIVPDLRGESLSLRLMTELVNLASDRGHGHLFLFTSPKSADFFERCGFRRLVQVPDVVVMMENTATGISSYCSRLQRLRKDGARIGSIVMNANPFTFGHQYLVKQAAAACDWLHVFVVSENASDISYRDRYKLVQSGIRLIDKVTLHHGSHYMISRATFPSYFIKEQGLVGESHCAVDLLLFRNYIAPSLGITHRYVGTEPFCPVTRKYNEDMTRWLQTESADGPAITVVEIPRVAAHGIPISASEVRRLLKAGQIEGRIDMLAPPATVELLIEKYRLVFPNTSGTDQGS